MSDTVIRVENLSKRYRIGLKAERHDTFAGMLTSWVRSPLRNYRRLRRLTQFDDGRRETEDGRRRTGDGETALPSSVSGPPFSNPSDVIWALKDVSFEVKQGEVVGIIGRNGAGKSTLLKILSRITHPTSGRVELHGRVSSLLEVGTGFHPELTGRENIYLNGTILGMTKAEIDKKFDEIVDFSGVEKFIDTPVKHYSSGMRVRLAFSVAAHLEPEILLVDEVLAVGDAEFQKKCLGKMGEVAKEGRTVLFVSHNMTAVQHLCQRGFLLDGGEVSFSGAIEDAVRSYISNIHVEARADLADRRDRKGSQWLRFTRVALYDSEGNELQQVMSGQDVYVRLYYRSEREKRNASVLVAFNVRNSQGYLLANLNTVDTGHDNLEIYHDGYFECWWHKFNLRSGTYDCTVFCSVNGEIVDWVRSAFLINVEDGDYYGTGKMIERKQGEILIDHSWACGRVFSGSGSNERSL